MTPEQQTRSEPPAERFEGLVENEREDALVEEAAWPRVTPDAALLHATGLVKVYGGRRVVNDVEIVVKRGEIVGLLGKNGAGKTTTFYIIVGLIRPDAGTVVFGGTDITRLPMHRRALLGMGYLSPEPSTFRTMTVEQNILAILETLEKSAHVRQRRCRRLLEELDIAHLAKQRAYTLSGGERRRLEICRALVTSPSFIMLDEPFSGVDPIAVFDVQRIIQQLSERGIGVLLTDHNVRETLSIVDRGYIINEGVVEVSGPSEFLINDPTARRVYLGEQFTM
jgi:lipopolysaccharide export system ATP-binding protein